MKTTEVLYTRNFTDLGPLQSAHILQYALTTDPGCALRYGVSVTVILVSVQSVCRGTELNVQGIHCPLCHQGSMEAQE